MAVITNQYSSVIDPNAEFPIETLEKCLEFGNLAGERGDTELAMHWYIKGRKLANETDDLDYVKRFSVAIAMCM